MEERGRGGNRSKNKKNYHLYSGLHTVSKVEYFYLPRSEGDRRFVSIDNCINDEREN